MTVSRLNAFLTAAITLVAGVTVSSLHAYTWTGDANDGGLWTTPANWGVTSGYPQNADDPIIFNGSANVSLNTGAQTDIAYIDVSAGNVVMTATSGSSLKINRPGHGVNGGGGNSAGFVVREGASLDFSVPLAEVSGRFDKQGTGRLIIRDITVPKQDTASWYVFNGTNEFVGTAFVNQPNADFTVGLGTPYDKSFVIIKDSARIAAKLFSTSVGGEKVPDTKIIQDGAGTEVSVSGRLDLRNNSGNDGHCYTLKSGTLSASELQIAPNNNASANYAPEHLHYIQEGGTSTFATVTLTKGSAALRGGVMNIPSLSAITTDGGCVFSLDGGTLSLSEGTFASWTDCRDAVAAKVSLAPGASIGLAGTSSLSIPRSFSTYDIGLEIGEGKTVTVPSGAMISAPRGSTNDWKVTLNDGSSLKFDASPRGSFAPMDLAVNGTGKIHFYSPVLTYGYGVRGVIVAHRLVVDGVAKPKGRYDASAASANSFIDAGTVASVRNAASILVPTIWTGAGGDNLWSNPANWDNNTVPNGNTAVADVSQASSITLDSNITLNALVAIPNGAERKVTITGSGTITLHSTINLQCNVFLPEDCELVLGVNLKCDSKNSHGVVGGGKLVVKKSFPGCTGDFLPYLLIDGTLVLSGTEVAVANSTYLYLSGMSYESGDCNVLIEEGTSFSASRFLTGINSYSQPNEFRQLGGNVTYSDFFLNCANSSGGPPCYYLDGGTLTVNAIINLNRGLASSESSEAGSTRKRYPGGSFEMSGGTLNCNGMRSCGNQNYFRLYGGTVNLNGDMNMEFHQPSAIKVTNRNDIVYYLGGVTIHPKGAERSISSGNVWLTGKNGDCVLDVDEQNFNFSAGTVAGSGGLVVQGSKLVKSSAPFTFTGSITVKSGNLSCYYYAPLNGPTALIVESASSVATFGRSTSKALDKVVLAASSCLVVASGETFETKRLVVGGQDVPAGTYTGLYGAGSVKVTGSAPSSWVANGDGDLSWFANGTTTTVDAATTLSSLAYAPIFAGETNTLAGAALTFEDGANIHVEKGNVLVIDNDVVLGGKVTKTGWGEIVFNGGVTSAVTPAADTDSYWLTVTEGGATFDGAVTGIRLVTCGSIDANDPPVITLLQNCTVSNYGIILTAWNEANVACRGETHQKGATVDYSTTIFDDLINNRSTWSLTQPRSGGYGRYVLESGELRGHNSFHLSFVFASGDAYKGSFEFVQNGGTFIEPKNFFFSRVTSGVKFTYTLNGGRFEFGGSLAGYTDPALNVLNLNGGTYVANGSDTIKREAFTLTTSGTVAFEVASGKTLNIADDGTDAVSIIKTGAGSLTLDGMFDLDGLDVQGGTVTLTDKTRPALNGSADLSMARTATLNLDYDGTATFKTLTVGGIERGAGVYSATKGPPAVKKALAGAGELCILEGNGPGSVILIR